MKNLLSISLFVFFLGMNFFNFAFSSPAVIKPLAILDRSGGGGGGGNATAISLGSTGVAAAGGAAAFAPLLLVGLSPNTIIAAAAPIDCIACKQCFLQKAIMNHFGTQNPEKAISMLDTNSKIYFAQNDSQILNGTFDMQGISLPESLLTAQEVRVKITIFSDPYNEVREEPELKLGLYKDISQPDLRKKFETQQFTRYYLMKKYDIPLKPTLKEYNQGVQKLSGIINIEQLKIKPLNLQAVITFTQGGFQKNQAVENPKVKTYAYLLEVEKIR